MNGIRTLVGVGDCCWHPSNPQRLSESILSPEVRKFCSCLNPPPKPSQAPVRAFVQRPPCTQAKPHPLPLKGQLQGHACLAAAPSGVADTTSLWRAHWLCRSCMLSSLASFSAALMSSRHAPSLRGPPELRSPCRSHLLSFEDVSRHGCVSGHGTCLLQSTRFSCAALYSPAVLQSLQSPAPVCYRTDGPLHVSPSCTPAPTPAPGPAPDLLSASMSLFVCFWFSF